MIWFTLSVGPSRWKVRIEDPETCSQLRDADGSRLEGCCLSSESTIYLNGTLPADRLPDVMLHELLHGVLFVGGGDKSCELTGALEERLVSSIAPTLTDALLRARMLKLPKLPRLGGSRHG